MTMTQETGEYPKDVMITFKGCKRGKNKKGGDRYTFSMDQEKTLTMIEELTKSLEVADNTGVKLDFHVSEKPSNRGGMFDSAICFCKAILPFDSQPAAKEPVETKKFEAKQPAGAPSIKDKIAALKNKRV